jgi:hypothetical protein
MYANIRGTRIHYIVEGEGPSCMVASLAGTPIYERTFSANLRRHLKKKPERMQDSAVRRCWWGGVMKANLHRHIRLSSR